MTTDSKPRGADRYPCFDGLRAIAALLVIGVHTTFASGFTGRSGLGNYTSRLEIGVEVFFVVSGFLLYRPFAVDHFGGRAALRLRAFWGRRLRRIIPAYWLAFLVVSYVMHADTVRHAWFSPLVYLGFAQIYLPHYVLSGLTQAWSLCTEMSFYLFLPLWAALVRRYRADNPDTQLRRELVGLAGLCAVGLGYRFVVLQHHSQLAQTMPNWLPGYIDLFSLGMLLAVVSAWCDATGRRPAWLWHPAMPWVSWLLAGAAFVSVSNIGLPLTPVTPSPLGLSLARQTLYGLFGFFMVVPAVFGPQGRTVRGAIRGLLACRPLAMIGVVSYGVYLWHESWMNEWFRWSGDRLFTVPFPDMYTAVTALAVAAASVSYFAVERPVIGWRRREGRRRVARSPQSQVPESAAQPAAIGVPS